MSLIAVITARGNSRRLRNKNILDFAGKPLIAHTILAAKGAGALISRIVLTTDSQEIAEIGRQWGASVPFLRPAELATSSATSVDTVKHCVDFVEREEDTQFDWVLLLQPTSPLRNTSDIISAIKLAGKDDVTSVISVNEISESYFTRMKVFKNGFLQHPFSESGWFKKGDVCYVVNGLLYLTRRDVLMERSEFYGERSVPLVIPSERSIDIDTEADFVVANRLYQHFADLSPGENNAID